MSSDQLFLTDSYRQSSEANVLDVNDRGGIILDQTVFYATSGGQPGDTGQMTFDGGTLMIGATIYGPDKQQIIHVPMEETTTPKVGSAVQLTIDWQRRLAHMRMHTALHLLCSLVPFPVTGGSIGAEESRLDFDISEAGAVDKEILSQALADLVVADHPVASRWISNEELSAKPDLVRTMSVKPPMGSGQVRLVSIGNDDAIDLQPCGGTHVGSTGEIGPIHVSKIEKKGRQNRRIRLRFGEPR